MCTFVCCSMIDPGRQEAEQDKEHDHLHVCRKAPVVGGACVVA